jgi:hypothetical protein
MEIVEEKLASAACLPVEEEPFVCRRVVSKGMVVAALHPVAGPIYWNFVDESDCNAPDHYGITDRLESATVFKSGYYHGRSFDSFKSCCLEDLVEYEELWNEEKEDLDFITKYSWKVQDLAAKAGCTPAEIAAWLRSVTWVEYPAPVKVYFLQDFNGYLGYRPEWSENVADALHWSRQELANKDDLDSELALSLGQCIPISQAMNMKPIVRKKSQINHALEADYAWTMHRLDLSRRRDWSKASGMASWLGEWTETAWIHAAHAGVEHFRSGENLPISGHIAAFPELLVRFNMALDLARYEALQQQPN